MTALSQYARLETTGRWRAGPGEAAQEVGVSFGNATLVLADDEGRPLAHWSLPAVARLNPGRAPAVFAPDPAGSESLEIDDDLMVDAIERVRRSLARARPRDGRGLRWAALLIAAALLAAGAAAAPGALRREALAVMPPSKRGEIGATLLGHLQRRLGEACRDPLGAEALARLHERVAGAAEGQVVVLPLGPERPLLLPGGIAVLGRDLVERAAEPAVVAGHVIAARAGGADPLAALLAGAGTAATLRLLVTGAVSPEALEAHAAALLRDPPAPPPPEALRPAFAAAEVPLGPYARDLDPTGATSGAAASAAPTRPILSDAEWLALQGVCG